MHSDLNVIDFQKMLIGPNVKFTFQDNINKWEWNIKPNNRGKYSLCLNISPVVFIGNNLESHFNVVNCHEVKVFYGFSKRFWDFINSAFFVAIFASLATGYLTYRITYYKKKSEENKGNKPST